MHFSIHIFKEEKRFLTPRESEKREKYRYNKRYDVIGK